MSFRRFLSLVKFKLHGIAETWTDEFFLVESKLNQPRRRGHRERKKFSYVVLVLGTVETAKALSES